MFITNKKAYGQSTGVLSQGVQRILILRSVVLDFVKLNLFALMLLCVIQCMMWRLYFAFVNCLQHLEILSEIWVMPRKLQTAIFRASLIYQALFPDLWISFSMNITSHKLKWQAYGFRKLLDDLAEPTRQPSPKFMSVNSSVRSKSDRSQCFSFQFILMLCLHENNRSYKNICRHPTWQDDIKK